MTYNNNNNCPVLPCPALVQQWGKAYIHLNTNTACDCGGDCVVGAPVTLSVKTSLPHKKTNSNACSRPPMCLQVLAQRFIVLASYGAN
mmetsp:Transcript_13636/g.22497  ORF Transcript_13636/g.22497 Transcript_13636/m.22497 type:complete len:88 (-) Transcript_13636:1064-1327(-)